jgi:flagella basal body P-ring formation protein FlgA
MKYNTSPLLNGLLALASLVALPVTAGEEAAQAEATIRIREEAYIKGPKVYLGDLVEVQERDLRERLAHVEVSSAASPGSTKQLSASLVEARLEHAGVDLDDVARERPRQIRATTMHLELSPEMLMASLRDFIQGAMPWDAEVTEIDVPLPQQAIQAPEGELIIDWRPSPQYRFVGPSNFRGDIIVDGELFRSIAMRASVETYQEIVVADTDIPRGRPVTESQIRMETIALSRAPDGAITDPGDVMGLIARKTIFPNQPITARNVEPRRIIRRNQTVLVEVNNGRIHIQHQARAMMDGKAGDLIVCTNLNTKEEFQGIVRPDGVVEVR